jgi:glycosyltransferase involved in cell wall biosynthesis
MRVLHVIPAIAPRYGGPSTAVGPLCAALNRLPSLEAEIATTDADGRGGRLGGEQLPPGVKTHLFRRTFSEQWKFSAGLWQWLRRHVRDYDLLHLHAVWSFATAAAGAAARRAGTPYVIRPAGMLSEYTWARGAWKKRLYWHLLERRTLRGAAAFHATSTTEAQEIQAACPGARTFVLPNGVEAAAWETETDPQALRRRCGAAAGRRPIVLFLSRLHPKKGLTDLLLPAFARLRGDFFLALAGGPDPHAAGYEQEVRAAIQRFGLADRAALLGSITAAERWQLFDGAALFVLPSHAENFGIVVAEAMARGTPVVVTDAVQCSEHVRAAEAGRVVPRDVAVLARTLEELLVRPQACAALGDSGRHYARAQFRWERIALELQEAYRACLRRVPSPGTVRECVTACRPSAD